MSRLGSLPVSTVTTSSPSLLTAYGARGFLRRAALYELHPARPRLKPYRTALRKPLSIPVLT